MRSDCAACRSISCTARSTGCFRCRWRGRPSELLSAAGADVTYREIDDLSHCYPREINPAILNWLRRRGQSAVIGAAE